MENISNISSEEELLRLRNDGKISEAEYQELLAAIRKSPAKDTKGAVSTGKFFNPKDVPWQIWVVVVLLTLEGIGNLSYIPKQPMALVWLGAKCLFIFGLLKRWRCIFCLFVIIGIVHVVYFLFLAPVTALINLAMVVLVLSAYRFYFFRQSEYNYLIKVKEKLLGLCVDKHTYQNSIQNLKHKQGKIALVLMLLGFILPFSCFFIIEALAPPNAGPATGPWFFLGFALELAALVMGVVSWTDDFGKGAVAGSVAIIVIALLFIL